MTRTRKAYAPGRSGLGRHLVLVLLAVFALFPLILTVSTTLKSSRDVRVNPFGLFTSFSGELVHVVLGRTSTRPGRSVASTATCSTVSC